MYVCVCVFKCICMCMCVYVYIYIYIYIYIYYILSIIYYILYIIYYIFFPLPLFVCGYRFSTRCILIICNRIPDFPFVKLNGHLSRLAPHGYLQVACTLFFVKFKFHTN